MGFWDLFSESWTVVNGHEAQTRGGSDAAASSQSSTQDRIDDSNNMCSSSGSQYESPTVPAGLSESDFARLQEMFTTG